MSDKSLNLLKPWTSDIGIAGRLSAETIGQQMANSKFTLNNSWKEVAKDFIEPTLLAAITLYNPLIGLLITAGVGAGRSLYKAYQAATASNDNIETANITTKTMNLKLAP